MKFYSEKGYTGVDIAISVIVIFIFDKFHLIYIIFYIFSQAFRLLN